MYRILTALFCLFVTVVFAANALANDENCNSTSNNPVRELASNVVAITAVAGPRPADPRKQLSEIAKDEAVKALWPTASSNDFSAVQIFICGDAGSSAVLACDGETILTSGHSIWNKDAKLRWEGDSKTDCYFVVEKTPGDYEYFDIKLPTSEEEALKISGSRFHNYTSASFAEDWAVLKLKTAVPSSLVKPADLLAVNSAEDLKGQKALLVAGYSSDFGDQSAPPKTYDLCENVDSITFLEQNLNMTKDSSISKERLAETSFINNCKTAGGNSGGGYYSFAADKPRVSAIHAKGLPAGFGPEKKALGKSYGARAVPISGRFRAAIENATSNEDCIKTYTPPSRQARL